MRRLVLLVAFIVLCTPLVAGQARTAERIISVPFSQLSSSLPDGSVRTVINGSPTAPCTVGTSVVFAMKLNGVWNCSDLTAGSPAPTSATYITQTPHSTLTNEQALSALATGILKSTTATGMVSIAVAGTDYLAPNGNGSQLVALNAAQLTSGTIPDARFPATLPATSGINLTSLNANNLSSGTLPDARFPTTLPTLSGANLTALNASALAGGTVAPARLGTGSGGSTKFLREDNTWQTISGGGDALTSSPLSQFASTTSAQFAGVISNETGTGLVMLNDTPTILTPTIASFANATHNHTNGAGGGQLTDAALSTAVSISKGGTGQTTQTAAFNALDPLTTKGDTLSHDGTNSVRLAVGSNGLCLKANSVQTTGLEWGTCGTGTIGGSTGGTDNAVLRADGTGGTTVQSSAVTIDDTGNISTAGSISLGIGSSVAGTFDMFEGTAPALVANTFSMYAPVDVAAGGLAYVLPATAATGFMLATNSSGAMTISHVGSSGTGNVCLTTSCAMTTPNLGTPSAGTLTNATGLPISTGVSGLGTGVATFLGTPSSANLASAVTGETGTAGGVVFSVGPTISDLVVTGSVNIPNGAAPTTDAFGEIAGDNNAWAASRGAPQFFDGTANTYLIGVLASDTPSNGQVPTWNTGGTVTWETPSGGGGTSTLAVGPLGFSNSSSLSASTTFFTGVDWENGLSTADDNRSKFVMPVTGTVTGFFQNMVISGTNPSSATVTMTLRCNGSDTAMVISHDWATVGMDDASQSDTTHTASVTAGQRCNIKIVTPAWSTTPTGVRMHWTLRVTVP